MKNKYKILMRSNRTGNICEIGTAKTKKQAIDIIKKNEKLNGNDCFSKEFQPVTVWFELNS